MKKFIIIVFSVLLSTAAFAQRKDKIKGTKNVTVSQREVTAFENIEVEDNVEIFLVKGAGEGIEIEADDNLHEVIQTDVNGSTLRIFTSKDVTRFDKFIVRVTYTENLKSVTGRHETVINALADLEVDTITVKNFDYSKSYLNVKASNFSLYLNDKTKAEINYKGNDCVFELSKKANLKALVAASNSSKFDLYQESEAVIEGDALNALLRVDNSASFTGAKFTVKNLELVAEGYSNTNVMAAETAVITAKGKAEIGFYGDAKIELKTFADSAAIYKRQL
ncbi:DUF2807 domain-containing protein [Flavobacterium rakeshii]|uniref:GIN domain-containing protein n=1 Tax=Flavobacterium rakeshii TaxID=1038845 RepID=UPI002E7C01BC|nr:DUF2807 domain-containing protein [Flavobacterium rakeshii]MEE1897040.1 DUF2807 domain-containing protein [Flavobacterium rakeshii]